MTWLTILRTGICCRASKRNYTLLVDQLYDLSGYLRRRLHRQWNKHCEPCQFSKHLKRFCTFPTIVATNEPFQTPTKLNNHRVNDSDLSSSCSFCHAPCHWTLSSVSRIDITPYMNGTMHERFNMWISGALEMPAKLDQDLWVLSICLDCVLSQKAKTGQLGG